ncbi:MAG: glycosyltransferase, partial [Thermoplasmata archaeon]|nr:glycosyltransferase [Thermoplasmata archaeon]
MKRVMMLLSNPFRPDPRVHKEARSLVAAGYDVKILCWDREQDHAKDEKVDAISIKRLGPASAFARPLRFIITLPCFWLKAFPAGMREDWQILHCHDLDTLPVGILMAKLKRRPLVYDSHEIYSSMVGEVMKGIAFRFTRWLESNLVKMPDAVICVNDRFRSILERWGARRVT